MANIIQFPGNSQKTPEQPSVGSTEAPIIRQEITTGDYSLHDMYAHVVRMPLGSQAIEGTATAENDARRAALAREAINRNPLFSGEDYVQKTA